MRKLEAFWFKYFSYATRNTDDAWVRWVVVWIMLVPAAVGVTADLFDKHKMATIAFLVFTGLMVTFAVVWITVWFYHNWRLRRESKK